MGSSTSKGTRRALLIGYCYRDTDQQLKGCNNDLSLIKQVLLTRFDFDIQNIRIIADESHINIELAFKWLVKNSNKGDQLFFYFSGHSQNGNLVTENLRLYSVARLYKIAEKLSSKTGLIAVIDACESDELFDLPYRYSKKRLESLHGRRVKPSIVYLSSINPLTRLSHDLIDSTSNQHYGILTLYLTKYLISNPLEQMTYKALIDGITETIRSDGYEQVPSLKISKKELLNEKMKIN